MSMIKNLLKVASKGKPNILWKGIANWEGANRFCKKTHLAYEL